MKPSHTIRPTFDDPNVVSDAGVVPALRLGESAGLYDLLEEALTVDSPNATAKTTCVVGGMLADADSIDDLELLRHGGMGRLFGGIRAPSTLGTFLRSFTHGHVQQLDAVGGRFLAGLAQQVPGLVAGADASDGIAFIDVDDTIRQVHGYAKQVVAPGFVDSNTHADWVLTSPQCDQLLASMVQQGVTTVVGRRLRVLACARRRGARQRIAEPHRVPAGGRLPVCLDFLRRVRRRLRAAEPPAERGADGRAASVAVRRCRDPARPADQR